MVDGMGIRIDPTLEFVWRDPHTVQIGVDPVRAVVPVPTIAQERFLGTLRSETPRDALPAIAEQVQCSPERAAGVLGAVSPAVIEPVPHRTRNVEVQGATPVADSIAEFLVGDGVAVVRTQAPPGGPVPMPDPTPDVAVVVTEHVLDPAVRAAWTRREIPHLAVVIGDGRIRIGPLIEPVDGPCLSCIELARVDEDPHWPTLASQVWGRPAAPLSMLRTATIATLTASIVLARLPFTSAPGVGEQLVIERDDLSVTRRTIARHPLCACRTLPGIGSADGLPTEHSPAPTMSPSLIDELG
jgi:bacteriocin biosynthesis cyclodehydratase domain-containing protein